MGFDDDEGYLFHFMEDSLQGGIFNITVLPTPCPHATAHETHISAILMIGVCQEVISLYSEETSIILNALVVLADKRLAWISCSHRACSKPDNLCLKNKGLLCIHDELAGVLDQAGASWAEYDGCLWGVRQPEGNMENLNNQVLSCGPKLISNDASMKTLDGVSRLLSQKFRAGQQPHSSFSGHGASSRPASVIHCVGASVVEGEVIEQIEHSELPPCLDAEMTALKVGSQTEDDFVRSVEKHIRDPEMPLTQPSNKVYLISFRSGKGELFRKMLLKDKELKPLRKCLLDSGYPLVIRPSNVIVLVRPDQYLDTVSSLASLSLKRYKLAIAESEEYLVDEIASA